MGTHPIIESPKSIEGNTMVKLEKCPKDMNIEEFNKYNNYVESANKLLKKSIFREGYGRVV